MPAPDQMHMQVKDDLPSPPLDIDKETITAFRYGISAGHLFGSREYFCQYGQFVGGEIIDAADMFFRYNQQMNRCVGVDIFKYHEDLVFIQYFGGGLAVDNSTKEAALFHTFLDLPVSLKH